MQQQCPELQGFPFCGVHRDVCNRSWSLEDRGARGTGVLVVLGQCRATLKPRFVCAVVFWLALAAQRLGCVAGIGIAEP